MTSTEVSQATHMTMSHEDQITALSQLPASSNVAHDSAECPTESQPVWEMEVVMQGQAAQGLGKPDHKGSCLNAEQEQSLAEDGVGQLGMDAAGLGTEAVPSGYECVVVTQALMDRPVVQNGDAPSDAGATLLQANPAGTIPIQGQAGELFEPQTLQTVVSSCELPEQRGTLEASQVDAHLSKHGVRPLIFFTDWNSSFGTAIQLTELMFVVNWLVTCKRLT